LFLKEWINLGDKKKEDPQPGFLISQIRGLTKIWFVLYLYYSRKTEREVIVSKNFRVIGQRIKELRQERGWTQARLASRLRIGGSRLADIERGHEKPSNAMFFALSDIFCVPATDIYPDIDVDLSESPFYEKGKDPCKE